jgi:hypothetical protein
VFDAVVFAKMWMGEKLHDANKERGVIMRCGDGIFACGIPKTEIFRTCFVPMLKSSYQQTEMKKVLNEFVERLNASEENVDMN